MPLSYRPFISHVVAASNNNVIGVGNDLPWSLPNDLKMFKQLTEGRVVIMGRKTFDSIGRPLPGRVNIVVTRGSVTVKTTTKTTGTLIIVSSIDEALEIAYQRPEAKHFGEIFVIGGGELYKQTLHLAEFIHMTRVKATIHDGEVFYPWDEVHADEWFLRSEKEHDRDDKHNYGYSFQVWERQLKNE